MLIFADHLKMKFQSSFLYSLALLSFFVNVLLAEVLQYSDADFSDKLKSHKIALVAYYAPWCQYSQALLPQYATSSYILNDILKLDIALIKVDCYEANSINTCTNMKILSYPAMRVYKNGVFYRDFQKERTSDNIVYFMIDIFHGII